MWIIIGSPQSSKRTLAFCDFIRVPSPAARTITETSFIFTLKFQKSDNFNTFKINKNLNLCRADEI